MSVRVVVYAEGAGELRGDDSLRIRPRPRAPLLPEQLGPVHRLVQRLIVADSGVDEGAVLFEVGLRLRSGFPRGSQLKVRGNLERLLAYPKDPPQLAVICVDADEAKASTLRAAMTLERVIIPNVVAIAAPEFERWLVSDPDALSAAGLPALDVDVTAPRACKQWLDGHGQGHGQRITLANTVKLQTVADACTGFSQLRADLARRPWERG